MSGFGNTRESEQIVTFDLLGTLQGNTVEYAGQDWVSFPNDLSGPFGNEVVIRVTGDYGVNLKYLSYFLLQLTIQTPQGPLLLQPAERVYPDPEPQMVVINMPVITGTLGWTKAKLALKGRRFNSARYAAVGNDWSVTAEYLIAKDRLLPTIPELLRKTGGGLVRFLLDPSGRLIPSGDPQLPPG